MKLKDIISTMNESTSLDDKNEMKKHKMKQQGSLKDDKECKETEACEEADKEVE